MISGSIRTPHSTTLWFVCLDASKFHLVDEMVEFLSYTGEVGLQNRQR